jgi:hypothetical protein
MSEFTDSAILFKNDQRTGSNSPDYGGTIDFACEQCGHHMHRKLAGWIKVARNGKKFLTLSFRLKPSAQQPASALQEPDDSDLDRAFPDDDDNARF